VIGHFEVSPSQPMSYRSTRSWRAHAARLLVALYALCVMAPALALAMGDVANAHCLNAVTAQAAPAAHSHVHADGTVHSHADHGAPSHHSDGGKAHMGSCCGLFCLAGLPTELGPVVEQTVHASTEILPREDHLIGRGPDRINRPPIALLSL
jgi:hypothetical protein